VRGREGSVSFGRRGSEKLAGTGDAATRHNRRAGGLIPALGVSS